MQWPDKMITRQRAGELAGGADIRFEVTHAVRIRCVDCGQSCGLFEPSDAAHPGPKTSPDDINAAVLRHLVQVHRVSLSGGGDHG